MFPYFHCVYFLSHAKQIQTSAFLGAKIIKQKYFLSVLFYFLFRCTVQRFVLLIEEHTFRKLKVLFSNELLRHDEGDFLILFF